MPTIKLNNLRKEFNGQVVVPDLNLQMEDGEFTVFVGPSGCGKSTTLRMIAGLETLTSGEIYLGEREVSKLEPKERGLSMVFQDYALYPHMNVARNICFGLKLARYPKAEIEQRLQRVATMLGLSDLLQRKPAELSGGQRQRVAMGRALVRDTSTLLMDEPLSNLDAKLRNQMRAELALMRDKVDRNIIYVTHDQIEAMTLGDRIVVMESGNIQQQGSAQELYQKPVNKFVAGFIGSPTMNFVPVSLHGEASKLRARNDFLDLPLRALAAAPPSAELIAGIRPSSFQLADADATDSLQLQVLLCEYIGSHSHLLCAGSDGSRLTVELNSRTPVGAGSSIHLRVPPEDIYLFDSDSGVALY